MDVTKHIVRLKGKDYLMVAGRVILAHEDPKAEKLSIVTEYVPEMSRDGVITMKATVTTPKGVFTGYSSARFDAGGPEGSATVEVAETSAVGRALGFAGYGTDYGIASAEEMRKVGITEESHVSTENSIREQSPARPPESGAGRQDKKDPAALKKQMDAMYQIYMAAKRKDPSLPTIQAIVRERHSKDVAALTQEEVSELTVYLSTIAEGGRR